MTRARLIRGADLAGGGVADLLVVGDTIAAVGPGAAADAPAGTQRVDAAGLVALPGLVDLHVHLREPCLLYTSPSPRD